MDKYIEKWKQEGQLFLWHYLENERNYPGWHLSADKIFSRSFDDLIEKMLASAWKSQKLIAITPPTIDRLRVPNNHKGMAKWYTKKSLLLKHEKDSTEDHFSLKEEKDLITLSASTQNLILLRECVAGIFQGKNDFSIEIGEKDLWFW